MQMDYSNSSSSMFRCRRVFRLHELNRLFRRFSCIFNDVCWDLSLMQSLTERDGPPWRPNHCTWCAEMSFFIPRIGWILPCETTNHLCTKTLKVHCSRRTLPTRILSMP